MFLICSQLKCKIINYRDWFLDESNVEIESNGESK